MRKYSKNPELSFVMGERKPRGLRAILAGACSLLLLVSALALSSCGGSHSPASQQRSTLSGNWQFTLVAPSDGSFTGGPQGGFLLQNNSSVTGQMTYAVSSGTTGFCSGGSASVSGSVTGQNVTLTAVAGSQTFSFTGTESADGSTITGTYSTTAGIAPDGTSCGTVQSGLQWSAISIAPITGTVQGNFHSSGGVAGLSNQDFLVTGSLTQGNNIGASSATVTGTLNFTGIISTSSDYPCFGAATVNGQISGSTVILQIIGNDGAALGQIGGVPGSGLTTVTLDSVQGGGQVLHNAVSPGYGVNSKTCPGAGPGVQAGDFGNLCLALGNASACQQPLMLSPADVSFPLQILGSPNTTQTITLTNSSSSTLSPLTLNFINESNNAFPGQSDFTGVPSFTETDTCGTTFSLAAGQSCSISISFSPQESCPWLPFPSPPSIAGAAPEWCPFPQSAKVIVTSPESADGNKIFTVPITGLGASAIQPSTSELDFGAEEALNPPESSVPQTLTFKNNSTNSVQVLPVSSNPCTSPLVRPLNASSGASGLQVVGSAPGVPNNITPNGSTITYQCDSDPSRNVPNFQLSADTCSGAVLSPQGTCSINVSYVPQPTTNLGNGLDYFLQLNTLECSGTVTANCEIDSGRFPVELKANSPSPIRLSPSAGIDFGTQATGQDSLPLTVTLLNDPNLAQPQTVTFIGKIGISGSFSETDDCPVTLAAGSSCTVTVTFHPRTVGFTAGALTINYSPEVSGLPQFVYLRGTGQ